MSSAALVGHDGSIDWCCFPRFDSPSVFASILDPDVGGHFRINPVNPFTTHQEYQHDSNVLVTTFSIGPAWYPSPTSCPLPTMTTTTRRRLPTPSTRYIASSPACRARWRCVWISSPGTTTAVSHPPSVRCVAVPVAGAVEARGGRQTQALLASIPLPFDERGVVCDFTLRQGQTETFVLAYGSGRPGSVARLRTAEKLGLYAALLAGAGGTDELSGAVARRCGAFLPGSSPDDVPQHRGHRRCPHHQPA